VKCASVDLSLVRLYESMGDDELVGYADNHFSGPTGKELARELAKRLRARKEVEYDREHEEEDSATRI
jgi:hypothetical protein